MSATRKEPRIVASYRVARSVKEKADKRAAREGTVLAVEIEKFVNRYSKRKYDKDAGDGQRGK